MDSNVDVKEKPEIKSFRDELAKEAERMVLDLFPPKILELNRAIESEQFNVMELSAIHWSYKFPSAPPLPACNGPTTLTEEEQPATKKRKLEEERPPLERKGDGMFTVTVGPKLPAHFSGVVPCNPNLLAIVDFLKPEIVQLVERCNKIKTWIQLMIPKIEDGNNFGVSIQEDILAEVGKAEGDSGAYLEQISRFFGARAKLVSKVAKYPYLDDYRRGVDEYDEKVFVSFKLILRELRNIYVVLYDLILKNHEKLVCPRNSNTSSLY